MESLSPVPRYVRRMGLTFENFIPIHQAHSYCREPLLPLRQDVPDRTAGCHTIISSTVCYPARSEYQRP